MAIGRCSEHPFERVTKEPYNVYAFPLGYPQTAAICGRPGCENPARIWLTPDEVTQHRAGARVFDLHSQAIKARVGDDLTKPPHSN